MRRIGAIAGLAALIATAAMVILPSSAGAAQATTCTGVLPSGTYGGVVVPAGSDVHLWWACNSPRWHQCGAGRVTHHRTGNR